MGQTLRSKYFWLLTILAAAVIFSIGINSNKNYQAEIRLLILPRSGSAAQNIDQIIENAKEIPQSLSFYDKLIELNPNIEDGSFSLPDQKRKEAWNAKMQIKRIDKSGIISISASSNDQTQAEIISNQVAKDLAFVMGKYYNTGTDLDIRVIDGPIAYLVSQTNFLNWILIGLIAGFLINLAIFSAFGYSSEKIAETEKTAGSPFSLAGLAKYDFRRPDSPNRDESLGGPTPPIDRGKMSSAPENLPIGDEPIIAKAVTPEEMSPEEKKYLHREATPEEVKERLNSLLRGNL